MNVVSFGGGTNSTAMLVGMYEMDYPEPDLILFADTGAEKPHTYDHIQEVNVWLAKIGWPEIIIVNVVDREGKAYSIEDYCLRLNTLPSVAFGFKSCSQKFKGQPQEKYLNNHEQAKAAWAAGQQVIKYIGYDADEPQRAKDYSNDKYSVEYPLIEWDWGRKDCIAAIARAGLRQPGKSSCFFCPNSRPCEIREMAAKYPDLADRALKIESNAELTSIKGLGRGSFAWKNLLATDDMFDFPDREMPCGCGI